MTEVVTDTKWVAFKLDGAEFALPIEQVQVVERMKPITKIPKVPPHVEGVINLRGQVVPTINLRKRLGLTTKEPDNKSRIMIMVTAGGLTGLIVDEVTRIVAVAQSTIEPPPDAAAGVSSEFIRGVAKPDGRLLILMDYAKVIDGAA